MCVMAAGTTGRKQAVGGLLCVYTIFTAIYHKLERGNCRVVVSRRFEMTRDVPGLKRPMYGDRGKQQELLVRDAKHTTTGKWPG